MCFSCVTDAQLLTLDTEWLLPVLPVRQKEGDHIFVSLYACCCSLSSSMRTAAPRKRKEASCRVLKCSHYSGVYNVWFCIQGRLGHYWLTEKGVVQKYLPVDAGECPAEAVLCGCKFRGGVSKRFCFRGMQSLPQLFSMREEHINYTSLLEVEEKASGVPFLLGFTKPNVL